MLIFLLAIPLASAAWVPASTAGGCNFYKGDAAGAVTPMRAECDWPIAAEAIVRALDDADELEAVFSTIDQSRVLGPDPGGGKQVYQSYKVTAVFQREVVLSMASIDIPGGRRFTWKKASNQSALTGQRTEIESMANLWEVTGTSTGCHLVFEVSYAPGASVPGFVLDWFQGTGVQQQLGDLRSYAATR